MRKASRRLILAALLVAGLSIPAEATIITTSGLSITNQDKLFNNFTCSVVVQGTGVPTNCSGIDVTADIDQFGNVGLQFQLGANVNTPGSTVDILIGYDATVVSGSQLISDVHLVFNGSVTGTGFTNVTETVTGLIPVAGVIGQAQVTNPPMALEQTINLSQLSTSVRVSKDILLGVNQPGPGTATISFIDQFLSQTPEPASLALFGTALLGWAARRRRRGQAHA
jgi:hypothetical protein